MNTLLTHFQTFFNSSNVFSYFHEHTYTYRDFWMAVLELKKQVETKSTVSYCLWENNSYRFLVRFFALLLANKKIYLPPNNLKSTINHLQKQDIQLFDINQFILPKKDKSMSICKETISWETLLNNSFYMQTSGSTGTPKIVERKLIQLFLEIEFLTKLFNISSDCIFLATVSHQHMFGLMYQLLLPFFNGASFYGETLLFTESLQYLIQKARDQQQSAVIATSQAFLARVTEKLNIKNETIFTAGGPLSLEIKNQYCGRIIEIYGSTETGGIAYSCEGKKFQLFDNVEIKIDSNHKAHVRSPYSFSHHWYDTGDVIELLDKTGLFLIKGRFNRLIKFQEKRISLEELEQKILALKEIDDIHIFPDHNETDREVLNAVCVLSKISMQQLKREGKFQIISQIRQQLKDNIEPLLIPKRWRFVNEVPRNSANKWDIMKMKAMFAHPLKIPQYSILEETIDQITLSLFFHEELIYFQGHFSGKPIFPGVAQLLITLHLAKNLFELTDEVQRLEKIKFAKIIQPYDTVKLILSKKNTKIVFQTYSLDGNLISSGNWILIKNDE